MWMGRPDSPDCCVLVVAGVTCSRNLSNVTVAGARYSNYRVDMYPLDSTDPVGADFKAVGLKLSIANAAGLLLCVTASGPCSSLSTFLNSTSEVLSYSFSESPSHKCCPVGFSQQPSPPPPSPPPPSSPPPTPPPPPPSPPPPTPPPPVPCFICVNFTVSGPPFNAPPAPTNATCSALAAYMNSLPDNYTWNCRSTTANSVKVCAYNTDTPKAVNSYCSNYSAIFPQVRAGAVTGLAPPFIFAG